MDDESWGAQLQAEAEYEAWQDAEANAAQYYAEMEHLEAQYRDDFSKKPQIIKENNMDTKPDEILKDSRPVIGLFNSSGDRYAQIGFDGVTRIEVYGQGAMHCDIPWAAIYKGDKLDRRINLQFVCEVYYGG